MGQIILRYDGKEEVYEKDDEEIKKIVIILNPLRKYKNQYDKKEVEQAIVEIEN